MNHDRETIKDLIQDLFIDLRHSSQNLGDVKHIKAYLFKSIRRKILEHNKKTEKEQSKSISNLIDFEVIFSPEQQLINQQLSRDKQKILQNALNTLTTRQREAIFHYFYEGLGYEEIGIIMEISNLKSVRNLIYRSLNAMRKQSSDFGKVLFSFL
ncbi:MAG: sigma-70 family RNA polymerase sigma factor [Bacteroidota bacterium]